MGQKKIIKVCSVSFLAEHLVIWGALGRGIGVSGWGSSLSLQQRSGLPLPGSGDLGCCPVLNGKQETS